MTKRTLVLSCSIYIHHLLKMEHQTKTELFSDFWSPVTVKHKRSHLSINGDEISGKVELLRRNYHVLETHLLEECVHLFNQSHLLEIFENVLNRESWPVRLCGQHGFFALTSPSLLIHSPTF